MSGSAESGLLFACEALHHQMAVARRVAAQTAGIAQRGMATIAPIASMGGAGVDAPVQARTVPRADVVSAADARGALARVTEPGSRFAAGALTLKPVAFKYRKWELQRYETICPFDACGTPIYVFSKQFTADPYDSAESTSMGGERIMRVLPRPDEDLMSDAISDKTRFGWEAMYKDRSNEVRVHQNGKTISTDATELALHVALNSTVFKGRSSAAGLGEIDI